MFVSYLSITLEIILGVSNPEFNRVWYSKLILLFNYSPLSWASNAAFPAGDNCFTYWTRSYFIPGWLVFLFDLMVSFFPLFSTENFAIFEEDPSTLLAIKITK